MSGVNAMDSYRIYFNLPIGKGTPETGIVYGIYTIGNLLGSFVAGPASDFRGSRDLKGLSINSLTNNRS